MTWADISLTPKQEIAAIRADLVRLQSRGHLSGGGHREVYQLVLTDDFHAARDAQIRLLALLDRLLAARSPEGAQ